MGTETTTAIDFSAILAAITWETVLRVVLILVICLVVRKVLMNLITRAIGKTNVDKTMHTFLLSIISIVLWFIIVLILADSVGIPVTSLLAVLSVAGLAVSLAVQGILSNLAGGMVLLSTKPFAVGEYVEAGGVSGTVLDIGLTYTRLKTPDGKIIFVPNSEISSEKIINYSDEANRRVDLVFSAGYDSPVEKVEEVIRNVVGSHPKTLHSPAEPFVRVSKYGSSAIEYTVRVWCANGDYWDVYFDVIKGVKEAFDANGIAMTYDHLNVHMVQD